MQIRIRKNTVSLIRTTYDPAIKRGRNKQLGTLPKDAVNAPDELLTRLTASERRKLTNWMAYRQQVRSIETQRSSALALPQILKEVTTWYQRQPKSPSLTALAKHSRDEFSSLLAAMSAAGVGRTRNRTGKKA